MATEFADDACGFSNREKSEEDDGGRGSGAGGDALDGWIFGCGGVAHRGEGCADVAEVSAVRPASAFPEGGEQSLQFLGQRGAVAEAFRDSYGTDAKPEVPEKKLTCPYCQMESLYGRFHLIYEEDRDETAKDKGA